MMNIIRPVLARLAATVVAMICGWLALKFGLTIDPTNQQKIVEAIIEVVGIMLGAYAASHKWLSTFTNPTDAASPKLAKKSS